MHKDHLKRLPARDVWVVPSLKLLPQQNVERRVSREEELELAQDVRGCDEVPVVARERAPSSTERATDLPGTVDAGCMQPEVQGGAGNTR